MSTTKLRELGMLLRAVSDRRAQTRPAANDARRRFLLGSAPARPTRSRLVRPVGVAAAACAALVALVVAMSWKGPRATTFEVGDPPIAGRVGEWLAAGEQPVPVRFSDGTRLELTPRTRLRVTATTPHGADVLIESGVVHAAIEHRSEATRWLLHAGPFEIRVTGTRFDASWEPGEETLRIVVTDGAVAVSGPLLPPGRAVVAGEFLVVRVRSREMKLGKGDGMGEALGCAACDGPDGGAEGPAERGVAADGGGATADGTSAAGQAGGAPARAAGDGGGTPAASWQELARQRKYRDAWTSIERGGFEQALGRAGASDLLALADVARFAGEPGRAKRALLELRRRFGAAGQSAFLLGRLAADQLGAPGEAIGWFETYLREEPNGPLAEQALGRLLDLQRRSAPALARSTAERYLGRYPNGAYAALARSLLEAPASDGADAASPSP